MADAADLAMLARAFFVAGHGEVPGPLTLVVRDAEGRSARLTILAPPTEGLAPIESTILETLRTANAAVPPKALARRSGYTYNSHFRGIMAGLVRRGLAVRTPDGYVLTDTA